MHNYQKIEQQPLLHLCITEPLRLGKARILAQNVRGILTYCPEGRFHCLAAGDADAAHELLSGLDSLHFIMLLNPDFAPLLQRFSLDSHMLCRQAAWLQDSVLDTDARLQIAPPDERAFGRIVSAYRMDSPEELRANCERGELFFARDARGADVGFVGLHPEGCFGLLEVFPDQRGKGYGAALEKHIIRFCRERGRIPYCQVNVENAASMNLQRKLGLAITEETLYMAWNDE